MMYIGFRTPTGAVQHIVGTLLRTEPDLLYFVLTVKGTRYVVKVRMDTLVFARHLDPILLGELAQ